MQILNGFLISYYLQFDTDSISWKATQKRDQKIYFCDQTGNVRLLACDTGSFRYIECFKGVHIYGL